LPHEASSSIDVTDFNVRAILPGAAGLFKKAFQRDLSDARTKLEDFFNSLR